MGSCCIADNAFGDFFRDIRDAFCSDYGCYYHPQKNVDATATRNIADDFATMKANKRKSSEKQEDKIIDYMNSLTNEFIQILENQNKESFGGKSLNINIEELKRTNDNLRTEIKGSIADYIDNKLVLTDPELSAILNDNDDTKRGKKFDKFVYRINKEAIKVLREKLDKAIENQNKEIKDIIQVRLLEVERSMEEAQAALNNLINSNDEEKERTKIEYEYKNNLAKLLFDEVEG